MKKYTYFSDLMNHRPLPAQPPPKSNVDVAHPEATVSPMLYGMMGGEKREEMASLPHASLRPNRATRAEVLDHPTYPVLWSYHSTDGQGLLKDSGTKSS